MCIYIYTYIYIIIYILGILQIHYGNPTQLASIKGRHGFEHCSTGELDTPLLQYGPAPKKDTVDVGF